MRYYRKFFTTLWFPANSLKITNCFCIFKTAIFASYLKFQTFEISLKFEISVIKASNNDLFSGNLASFLAIVTLKYLINKLNTHLFEIHWSHKKILTRYFIRWRCETMWATIFFVSHFLSQRLQSKVGSLPLSSTISITYSRPIKGLRSPRVSRWDFIDNRLSVSAINNWPGKNVATIFFINDRSTQIFLNFVLTFCDWKSKNFSICNVIRQKLFLMFFLLNMFYEINYVGNLTKVANINMSS